uniref:Uncharacterized protein n=1 Tax=Oryza punctata TaxID=4537 RepID=A0A0E0LZV3_ORYPU
MHPSTTLQDWTIPLTSLGYFLADWGLVPPSWLPTLSSGDLIPVLNDNSSPTGGLHLQAGRLRHCRDGYFVADWGLTPLGRPPLPPPGRPPLPPPGDIVPVKDGYFIADWRLIPPGRPPSSLPGDIVPVQDGYFIANWGLTPPGRPPTPSPGDIVPVQDGYFVADWRLALGLLWGKRYPGTQGEAFRPCGIRWAKSPRPMRHTVGQEP